MTRKFTSLTTVILLLAMGTVVWAQSGTQSSSLLKTIPILDIPANQYGELYENQSRFNFNWQHAWVEVFPSIDVDSPTEMLQIPVKGLTIDRAALKMYYDLDGEKIECGKIVEPRPWRWGYQLKPNYAVCNIAARIDMRDYDNGIEVVKRPFIHVDLEIRANETAVP